jgi:hypothetical protein
MVQIPFLDRHEERSRLRNLLARRDGSFGVLYGRRRLGKSRLLREVLPKSRSVYYVGDDRESTLQRAGLATEVARLIPGFDRVTYPDWDALFARLWEQAKRLVLALDEFPALVAAAPEIPSLLQKQVDRHEPGVTLLLAGSSQRLMQGLVLDRSAPLFGRAAEILKISPLAAGWIQAGLGLRDAVKAVEAYATWGGVPRYWELARDHADRDEAVRSLVLAPLGVLHEEPARLLLDDLRDTAQAASILSVIGRGAHRASEIASRLEKPMTSLSRPLQRLVELELVRRQAPFGVSPRESKRTLYQIADPFLRYWFRFVEPNRSRLEAGHLLVVAAEVRRGFTHQVGSVWEDLARASVPRLAIAGDRFGPASRWWGPGADRTPLEVDVVAESHDARSLLVGEAKWSEPRSAERLLTELRRKAANLPVARDRRIVYALWLKAVATTPRDAWILTPRQVLRALR